MNMLLERFQEHEVILRDLKFSASKNHSEKLAFEKLHQCTYSTYLTDQQRQDLLDVFIREPAIEAEEALGRVIPN